MMEMIIIVQVFPKKTIYLHSARPVVALWQRAVHRLSLYNINISLQAKSLGYF